ncbi:MAG: O-antigen ligase family protein [Sulfuricellaceae bacterium]|nr:O-antigen ligase family protein [Sulfuricellaceae bacterium]
MKLPQAFCVIVAMLLAMIFFVFPIPHTVALRNLFVLALIGMLITLWRKGMPSVTTDVVAYRNGEIQALGALTLWMFVQTSLWAADRSLSFDDFVIDWLGTLLLAWVGYTIVMKLSKAGDSSCADKLPAWIALALFAHACWLLGYQIVQWVQIGRYPLGSTPYGTYAVLSATINMAFALLAADLAVRWTGEGRLFPWSIRTACSLFFVTTMAVVAVKARNGVITVFAVTVLLALLLAWRDRAHWRQSRRGIIATLLALVMATSLLAVNFRFDERWVTFIESASLGLDTTTYKALRRDGLDLLPLLASGQPVDESAYTRVAMFKVALEGIASQPLGFGYGIGGFGHYIKVQYNGKAVSSHSGLLDFTLGNGLPGLVLFLTFCFLLFRRGFLAWTTGNPWGLALMLTLTNYFVRILLDDHFGSFRLKMVALLLGILYWLTIRPTPDSNLAK